MASVEEIILAEPRGFCAGVDRAIEIVERALLKFGQPIYVRHEIVHNTYVVEDLKKKGAIFIEDLADVPPGATLVFSAHGVSQEVRHEAERRGFTIFDATCPLVTKVHVEVAKLAKEGYEFIMIGHKGHPEVEGTMGQLDHGIHLVEDADDVGKVEIEPGVKLAVVTQTTLSVDDAAEILEAVKARFPDIRPAQAAGHLLCHPEPAGCRQADGARGRRAGGRRQPEQLEQQPAARAGRAPGRRVPIWSMRPPTCAPSGSKASGGSGSRRVRRRRRCS